MNIQNLGSDIAEAARDVGHSLEDTGSQGAAMASHGYDRASKGLRTVSALVASLASLRTLAHATEAIAPGRRLLGMMRLQRRPSVISRISMGAGFLVAGAAVGAGIALLLAPRTGVQMRKQIARGLRALQHDTEEAATQAVESVKTSVTAAANTVMGSHDNPPTPGAPPPSPPSSATRPDGSRGDMSKLDQLRIEATRNDGTKGHDASKGTDGFGTTREPTKPPHL